MKTWAPMDRLPGLRYSSGLQRFWMLTLTEEGRPGGTFLIFFGCDSEGRKTEWNHISMLTHKDLLLQKWLYNHQWRDSFMQPPSFWNPAEPIHPSVSWLLINAWSKGILVWCYSVTFLIENSLFTLFNEAEVRFLKHFLKTQQEKWWYT